MKYPHRQQHARLLLLDGGMNGETGPGAGPGAGAGVIASPSGAVVTN